MTSFIIPNASPNVHFRNTNDAKQCIDDDTFYLEKKLWSNLLGNTLQKTFNFEIKSLVSMNKWKQNNVTQINWMKQLFAKLNFLYVIVLRCFEIQQWHFF